MAMTDFGFRCCPIFHAEILEISGDEVVFSPLRCFVTNGRTILSASKRPCEVRTNTHKTKELLPPTKYVESVWRTKKTHPIGMEKPSCELLELPEIAASRTLSTLSTRHRLFSLAELAEARNHLEWNTRMERISEKIQKQAELRRRELERLEAATKETISLRKEERETRTTVERALLEETKKIAEHAGKVSRILGYRTTQTGKKWVVLQDTEDDTTVCVWATRSLERILDRQAACFQKYNV